MVFEERYNNILDDLAMVLRIISLFLLQLVTIILGVYSNMIDWTVNSLATIIVWIIALLMIYLLSALLSYKKVFTDSHRLNVEKYKKWLLRNEGDGERK